MPQKLQMNFINTRQTAYVPSIKTTTKLPVAQVRQLPRETGMFISPKKSSGGGGGCGCGGAR
jgi:hypothetical protein